MELTVDLSAAATDPLPIRQGGLMRCCIETWRTNAPPASLTQEGDLLDCAHCSTGFMIVRSGAWEWDRPKVLSS